MNPQNEREWALQQHADRLDRESRKPTGSDPALDRYRLIAHVVRTADLAPPPDLATRVMARLQDIEEQAGAERRLSALLGVLLLPAALATAAPQFAVLFGQLQQLLGTLPLGGALAAGSALLVAWGVDRVCQRRTPTLV